MELFMLLLLILLVVIFWKKKKGKAPPRPQASAGHPDKIAEVPVTFSKLQSANNYPWDKNRPSDNTDFTKANFLNIYTSKPRPISNNPDDFPRSFSYALHIYDPIKTQNSMLREGYLRKATPEEVLSTFTVDKLKSLLVQYGCPKTGKKADLVSRIIDYIDLSQIDMPSMCCISEKGQTFIDEHKDLIKLAGNPYSITYDEYMVTKNSAHAHLGYNDIIWAVFQRRDNFAAGNYGARRSNAYNRAEFLRRENRQQNALEFFLQALYYELNDPTRIIPDYIKEFSTPDELEPSQVPTTLLESIYQLKEYYSDELIERCIRYTDIPQPLIKRANFKRIIDDIFAGKQIDVRNYLPKGLR